MSNNVITIIVPCYNVEKYVKNTFESLIKQTYEKIKIIAIDDCSSDKTYEILKEIEEKNSEKVKVVKNEKNMGLSYTRNRGIKMASTEFIGFIDSDDYIDNEYYERLIKAILKEKADIAITDIMLVDEFNNQIGEIQKGINLNDDNIKKAAINNGLAASACNKLFRKEIIEKYPFLEGKINEDVASILPAVLHAKKIVYVDGIKYYYVQRNTSIQNSEFSEKRFDMFDAIRVCLEKIKDLENFNEYKSIILYHQILMLYVYVISAQKGFKNRQKYLKMFISKEKDLRVENDACTPMFVQTQRRLSKKYWFIAIKLLKLKSATIINLYLSIGHFLSKIKRDIINKKIEKNNPIKQNINMNDLIKMAKKQNKIKENDIKLSVVVPNYNYEKFLMERIYSILNQKEKIYELIILDDCSKDNSRNLIDSIVEKLNKYINIKKVYNETNSGIAFKQWQKGFNIASGDYVWIAEADDYCDRRLLKVLLNKVRKNNNVRIAYVDTAFINKEGNIFLKTIKFEIDLRKTGHWNKDFINLGENELKNYTFLNCTIANVSSCIIKKDNYDEIFEKAIKYRQAGDWVVYANVMKKGYIAYVNKTYNYYRVHGDNITSKMEKEKHLKEIKSIHKEIGKLITLEDWHYEEYEKRYKFLKEVWRI